VPAASASSKLTNDDGIKWQSPEENQSSPNDPQTAVRSIITEHDRSTERSEFADVLGGLSADIWDELAAGRLYSSASWLRFCAADVGGRTTTGAVHVSGTAGAAAVSVTAVQDETNAFYQWHTQLTERGLPSPDPVGILVGQRRGYQAHLLTSGDVSPESAASALLDRLDHLRADVVGSGILPSVTGGSTPCVAGFLGTRDVLALRAAGVPALPVLLTTDAWIPVGPGGWAQWLQSLPSKGRRDSVKQEIKAFARAGYQIRRSPLSECYREAAELLAATQRRYGHPYDLDVLAESFRRQAIAMGSAAQVLFCARQGESAVAFCLYYIFGDTLFVRAVGFDYPQLRGAAEYFNLVYYEPVRIAADHGLSWLHLGIESADAKALRGARLRPLWLLDLAQDSVLVDHSDQIRVHNTTALRQLRDSSSAVAKALDADLYRPFC